MTTTDHRAEAAAAALRAQAAEALLASIEAREGVRIEPVEGDRRTRSFFPCGHDWWTQRPIEDDWCLRCHIDAEKAIRDARRSEAWHTQAAISAEQEPASLEELFATVGMRVPGSPA